MHASGAQLANYILLRACYVQLRLPDSDVYCLLLITN